LSAFYVHFKFEKETRDNIFKFTIICTYSYACVVDEIVGTTNTPLSGIRAW